MLIHIKNSNNNFSYLIGKNPESPARISKVRKGFCVGWFPDFNRYCIRFIDGLDELSYSQYEGQRYEYLSATKYHSAFCALNCVQQYISNLYTEYDEVAENTIEVFSVYCNDRTANTLERYFDVSFTSLEKYENFRTMTLRMNDTFEKTLNTLECILLFLALDGRENMFIQDEFVEKYAKKLHTINAPFFIKYLFKTKLLRSKNLFHKLEQYLNTDTEEFEFGTLNDARLKFSTDHVSDYNVIDLGCGEGRYANRLFANNRSYIGLDLDEKALEKARTRCKYDECKFLLNTGDLPKPQTPSCVVCMEVIEHISWDELPAFFEWIKDLGSDKIVLSTPNSDFNTYYPFDDDDSRHEDHKWEKNFPRVRDMIMENFASTHTVDAYKIGDIVNGISSTQGYVLCRSK